MRGFLKSVLVYVDRLYRHAPLAFSRAKFSNFPSFSVADTDLQIRGSNGHPDPEIRGRGGRSQKKSFSALWASVWSTNKEDQAPGAPHLDLPLIFECLPRILQPRTKLIRHFHVFRNFAPYYNHKSSRVHFWCYRKQHWNRVGVKRAFNLRRFFGRTIAKNKYFCNVYQQVLSEVVASYM